LRAACEIALTQFSMIKDDLARERTSDSPLWTGSSKFGFRFVACYLFLSFFTVYGILTVLPVVGYTLEGWIEDRWQIPVVWLGRHVFHLQGIATQFHASDSRDTALNWIAAGFIIPLSLVVSLFWSLFDRDRREYQQASLWLRFIVRLALIFLMLRYGLMKVFPLQMPPPSLAVLNEPVGQTSPMTLLWTLIGLHPAYEILIGSIESGAAFLLVFRRTAPIGAVLTVVLMTNVLLFNMFFDVPVKLGAANVLILAAALLAPDAKSLFRYFWLRQPTELSTSWVPKVKGPIAGRCLVAAEALFVVFALVQFVPGLWEGFEQQKANVKHPSALTGQWHVDSILRSEGGFPIPVPVLTGEGRPMTDIYLEPTGSVMVRSDDARLWRAQAQIDGDKHLFTLDSGYFDGLRFSASYLMEQTDPAHLILRPTGQAAKTNGTVTLTRIPLPADYPLLERRFHWVNEWALER
jgi:hypothetical protein